MKYLLSLAILIFNGQLFWVPCELRGVFCPHFSITVNAHDLVKDRDLIYVAYEPAPSKVVLGVFE